MSSLDTAAVVVSLASARRLSPSLVLQPDRVQAFFNRALNGSIASLIQAPPFGGKTTFLKQVLKQVEENKVYQNIYWIDVRTSIALDQFVSTISRMAKLDVSSLEDLSAKLEDSDSLLIIDNFDLVEGRFEILEAFKNSASKLRLIGSVSFLPEIPTDLAFEVTTFSYEGLTEAEVTELVSKLKPDFKDRATEAFASTLGNPQLLRLYLTSSDFESSKTEYWKSILARLSQSARALISKSALCKQRYRASESFFLNQIAISEVIALKQTALIIDQDGPGEIKLTEKAKEYVVSTLTKDEQLQISRSMIEDLRPNTSALELEEELCWQLQNLGDLKAAAEVATTVVPRLYDKVRFKSVVEMTESIVLHLDPYTWNWRRLSMVSPSLSIAELVKKLNSPIKEEPQDNRKIWQALHLLTTSKRDDVDEFNTLWDAYGDSVVTDKSARIWADLSRLLMKWRFGLEPNADSLTLNLVKQAIESGIHPRIVLDGLMNLLTIQIDAGRIREGAKVANQIETFAASKNMNFVSPIFEMLKYDLNMQLGNGLFLRQSRTKLSKVLLSELPESVLIQFLYLELHCLICDGRLRQFDWEGRRIFQGSFSDQIDTRQFRTYEPFIQGRIAAGATLEVQDVLKSFVKLPHVVGTSSCELAEALLSTLDSVDNGRRYMTELEKRRDRLVQVDLHRVIMSSLEYEWSEGKIVSTASDFEMALAWVDQKEFPFQANQLRLYSFLFSGYVKSPSSIDECKNVLSFFMERQFPLSALRGHIALALAFLAIGNRDDAVRIARAGLLLFPDIDSVEDQSWLRAILAKCDALTIERVVEPLDLMSNAARNLLSEHVNGNPNDRIVADASGRNLVIERNTLRVRNANQSYLVRDRPVIVKMLICIFNAYPQAMDKETICREVWEERYNPLVHDTRIYTTIRRLREIFRPPLGGQDPIIAIDGRYRITESLVDCAKIE